MKPELIDDERGMPPRTSPPGPYRRNPAVVHMPGLEVRRRLPAIRQTHLLSIVGVATEWCDLSPVETGESVCVSARLLAR